MQIINQLLGWTIILGTFVTYGFQYKKLYSLKTTRGLDDNMLLLGCLSSEFNLMGIIGSNLEIVYSPNIYIKLLPIIQIFAPWLCLQINYLIYYIYETEIYLRKKFIYFNIIAFLILLILFPVSAIVLFDSYKIVSNVFNIFAAIFSILMWIPQIIKTWNLKNEGALSLWSLGCHATGCLLVIIFQLLEKQIFSTILPYIIALICESWLLGYCIYLNYKKKDEPRLLLEEQY